LIKERKSSHLLNNEKKMSPLQAYPSHHQNNNQCVITDESSSIAFPNQRNNYPQPYLPIIKIPFSPSVNPEDLIFEIKESKI